MGRAISQEAFEALVKENMEDLGMEPDEALEDAIETLTLQGVDLSGIIKCIPGVNSVKDNPVIQLIDGLKNNENLEKMIEMLDKLYDLCSTEGSDNASIAIKNGGVELLTSLCSSLDVKFDRPLALALKALSSILCDVQSSESFRQSGGPKIVVDILHGSSECLNLLDSGFAVVAAASAGNEIVKESFMDLKLDEYIMEILREKSKYDVQHIYDAIRILLTPDDNRVLASQVYGYARKFAKIGVANVLVDVLRVGVDSARLASTCASLKAIAVNLAGSDANKSAIVQLNGLDRLMKLSSRFSEDPSVMQEVMSIITVLSLRSPENAARAIEAGAGDLAIQAMQKFPSSYQMQRQSCLMIRNLVVRNPENRTILLSNGIEKLIRKAKGVHETCKDAATAALRDLGLDNYNI
ncbi:uncharacterized protein [Typha latifolia]|uniref:uncharacterized protein isoform X2 n=1 Tax=Typha latifolia TaxID=4733 RepID=UPI003C2E32BE